MTCSVCETGPIVEAKIVSTGATIFICEECDSIWLCNSSMEANDAVVSENSLISIELDEIWKKIEIVRTLQS